MRAEPSAPCAGTRSAAVLEAVDRRLHHRTPKARRGERVCPCQLCQVEAPLLRRHATIGQLVGADPVPRVARATVEVTARRPQDRARAASAIGAARSVTGPSMAMRPRPSPFLPSCTRGPLRRREIPMSATRTPRVPTAPTASSTTGKSEPHAAGPRTGRRSRRHRARRRGQSGRRLPSGVCAIRESRSGSPTRPT